MNTEQLFHKLEEIEDSIADFDDCEGLLSTVFELRKTLKYYELVPVEPNSRQLEAGKNAIDANGGEGDDSALLSDALEAYRAMIAAATETNVACDLCKGSGKKVVGPDQDGRKYKVDCDCTKP